MAHLVGIVRCEEHSENSVTVMIDRDGINVVLSQPADGFILDCQSAGELALLLERAQTYFDRPGWAAEREVEQQH